jgi:peptidoglycan/xylan/chitin deacetylase (PgdA/CDA1 family)
MTLRTAVRSALLDAALVRSDRRMARPRALILCYPGLVEDRHVQDAGSTEYLGQGRSVRLGEFRKQVEWLSTFADIVPLADLPVRASDPPLSRWRVALTFDDGYENNIRLGAEVMDARSIPMTWFVATHYCENPRVLPWWILLDFAVQFCRVPLQFTARGRSFAYPMAEAQQRERFRAEQRESFRNSPDGQEELRAAIETAIAATGLVLPANGFASPEQVTKAAALPWVTIGGHTHTHVNVARVPRPALEREVGENHTRLQQWTGQAVESFAFPYGSPDAVSDDGIGVLRQFGFNTAVTTSRGYAVAGSDRFRLPRVVVSGAWDLRFFQAQVLALDFMKPLHGARAALSSIQGVRK